MLQRKTIVALGALALAGTALGPASATDEPAYNVSFYSDPGHQRQVGFARAVCTPDSEAKLQWGYWTQYQQVDYVGRCVDGQLVRGERGSD
jgi:hypothetical protein